MQVWCGIAGRADDARAGLAAAMEGFYKIAFERFEKYSPYGTPEDVANFLRGYVEQGCTSFNLIPIGADSDTAFEGVVKIRALLNG